MSKSTKRQKSKLRAQAGRPSAAAAGPGPAPDQARSRRREAYKTNSPSGCAPPPPPPPDQARSRREKYIRPAARPAAASSRPGPKSAAGGIESKLPVQLRLPPPPPPGQARSRRREAYKANSTSSCASLRCRLQYWPEVGGGRRAKQTPSPAERPSAVSSGPGPKLAARGVESLGGERHSSRCYSCATLVGPAGPAKTGRRKVVGVGSSPGRTPLSVPELKKISVQVFSFMWFQGKRLNFKIILGLSTP